MVCFYFADNLSCIQRPGAGIIFVKILVSQTITRDNVYTDIELLASYYLVAYSFILTSSSFTRMEVLQVSKHLEYQNVFYPKCFKTFPEKRANGTQTRFEYISEFRRAQLLCEHA